MARFKVPLAWEMYGHLWVEADSIKEAIAYALSPDSSLPEGSYVDGSVKLDGLTIIETSSEEPV